MFRPPPMRPMQPPMGMRMPPGPNNMMPRLRMPPGPPPGLPPRMMHSRMHPPQQQQVCHRFAYEMFTFDLNFFFFKICRI